GSRAGRPPARPRAPAPRVNPVDPPSVGWAAQPKRPLERAIAAAGSGIISSAQHGVAGAYPLIRKSPSPFRSTKHGHGRAMVSRQNWTVHEDAEQTRRIRKRT